MDMEVINGEEFTCLLRGGGTGWVSGLTGN